jgi:hypothetical protein
LADQNVHAVLDALLGHGERERVGAADRGGRVLAAGDRVPAEARRHAADVLRVEHVHPALPGADRAGQVVDVGLAGGGDDRAGVAQDDIGEERSLVGPGRGHDQQVLLQRDPQAVPVVGPAQEHRVLARVEQAVPPGQGGADLAGAAQDREPRPAQPQAEQVGEALAWVQPQVQPASNAAVKLASRSCRMNFTLAPACSRHQEVPGLLHDPGLDRVLCGSEDPDAAGAVRDGGKDVDLHAVEQVGGEEVQRQDPLRLGPEEFRPARAIPA